jgi:hypothetical protein
MQRITVRIDQHNWPQYDHGVHSSRRVARFHIDRGYVDGDLGVGNVAKWSDNSYREPPAGSGVNQSDVIICSSLAVLACSIRGHGYRSF